MVQPQAANQYVVAPPRPYLWKTDEFQINDKSAPKTQQFNQQQLFQTNQHLNQGIAPAHPAYMVSNFRCRSTPNFYRRVDNFCSSFSNDVYFLLGWVINQRRYSGLLRLRSKIKLTIHIAFRMVNFDLRIGA
jgi:hypothetical protein